MSGNLHTPSKFAREHSLEKRQLSILRNKFSQYRQSAKIRGFDFALTLQQFSSICTSPCSYCGNKDLNGVDRIDNTQGYTLENSTSCCFICNRMKSNHQSGAFLKHIQKIYEHFLGMRMKDIS